MNMPDRVFDLLFRIFIMKAFEMRGVIINHPRDDIEEQTLGAFRLVIHEQ